VPIHLALITVLALLAGIEPAVACKIFIAEHQQWEL